MRHSASWCVGRKSNEKEASDNGFAGGAGDEWRGAWVERPAEPVRISDCAFEDEAYAILTLDDGRRLHVRLVGRGEVANDSVKEDRLTACIEIQADAPSVANMPPEQILSRLQLVWNEGCWVRHWADNELDVEAEASAIAKAIDALDWLTAGDLPDGLSPAERRETLLHREVKAILERERRIRVRSRATSLPASCLSRSPASVGSIIR